LYVYRQEDGDKEIRMKIRPALRIFSLIAVALMATGDCWALNPNGALRVEVTATPNFIVDSNTSAALSKTPRSAYITAKVWNDGPTDLNDVIAYIGNFNNGTNSTPGTYPKRSHLSLVGPLGGQFALTHEGGSSGTGDATRYLGTIKAGKSVSIFWLVSYPLFDTTGAPVFGAGSDPSDDLWLNYDIWASLGASPSATKADQRSKVTIRSAISSLSSKILPMTASQVPTEYKVALNAYNPAWTNVLVDGSVGSGIDIKGVWYTLGNVGPGLDADGDLMPDRDVCLQPVGSPSSFDAGAFRLIGVNVLLIVKRSGGLPDLVIEAKDKLYFKDIPDNTGVVGYVRYQFMPLKVSSQSQLTPYQFVAAGSGLKYNGDYGALLGTSLASGASPSAALTNNTSVTVTSPGGTIPYSITFTNNGTVSIGQPDLGVPLVIQERIPAGSLYVAGSASTVSNVPPAGMGNYVILYSTNNAVSWVTSEPSVATNVTDIQWWLTAPLLPGQTGTVRFSVQVANPYTQGPILQNTAGLSMGNTASFASSTASTTITGNNFIGDLIWYDTGNGTGIFGNKVKESGESGASNITVNLYYDSNTNGTRDATDLFVGTTASSSLGAYSFTNLVDGSYLAIIDLTDTDIPAGYTLSTPQQYVVNLDLARSNTNAVGDLTADFGLVAAMSMSKRLTSPGPAYEGRTVSYDITVTNNMAGDGLGGAAPVEYTVWATTNSASTTDGWLTNTVAVGAPDGIF
jgi:hypothetical protein